MKLLVFNHILSLIEDKILDLRTGLDSIKESRDSDVKSTAGDKHEVGRAMAQIELDNLEAQLQRNLVLKNELEALQLERNTDEVGKGNLVKTDQGLYFISIGLGVIAVYDHEVFVISAESPIGQLLMGKKKGDQIEFNRRAIIIEEIK